MPGRWPLVWALMSLPLLATRLAGAARSITLEDAVRLAVRDNPALAAAGAALAAARGDVLAARGLDDPLLAVGVAFDRARRERVPGVPVQERAVDGARGGASLRQPLVSGGSVGLELSGGYRHTGFETAAGAARETSTSSEHTPALQLSFEQPLARGLGAGVARAPRRQARLALDAAGAEREGLAASLVRDVVVAYWALAHSAAELEVRRVSLAAAHDQLLRARANIDVGKLAPSASAEIEVVLALREDAALLAQQAVTERALALGRLCAVPVSDELLASERLPAIDAVTPAPRELQATLASALAHSPALAALAARRRAGALALEVADDGLSPQLDLRLSGGPVANAPTPRAAYDQLTGFGSYAVGASLDLAWPVGAHAARGARDVARAGLRRAELDESEFRAQLTTAVAQGIAALETARRRALSLRPSLLAAALDLEAERARFDAGRGSNFDVLRRQDALAEVQLASLSAQLEAQRAGASLDAATHEILARHALVLREADE